MTIEESDRGYLLSLCALTNEMKTIFEQDHLLLAYKGKIYQLHSLIYVCMVRGCRDPNAKGEHI